MMNPEEEFQSFLKNGALAIVKKTIADSPEGALTNDLVFAALKETTTFPQAMAVAYVFGFLSGTIVQIRKRRTPNFPSAGRIMNEGGEIDLNFGAINPDLH